MNRGEVKVGKAKKRKDLNISHPSMCVCEQVFRDSHGGQQTMGKTGYDKCENLIRMMELQGYTNQIEKKKLRGFIAKHIGLDERTINNYEDKLIVLEFIKPINHKVYKIKKVKS